MITHALCSWPKCIIYHNPAVVTSHCWPLHKAWSVLEGKNLGTDWPLMTSHCQRSSKAEPQQGDGFYWCCTAVNTCLLGSFPSLLLWGKNYHLDKISEYFSRYVSLFRYTDIKINLSRCLFSSEITNIWNCRAIFSVKYNNMNHAAILLSHFLSACTVTFNSPRLA